VNNSASQTRGNQIVDYDNAIDLLICMQTADEIIKNGVCQEDDLLNVEAKKMAKLKLLMYKRQLINFLNNIKD
jgi:hypothetical protein